MLIDVFDNKFLSYKYAPLESIKSAKQVNYWFLEAIRNGTGVGFESGAVF
jgi:hypothetical protein